MGGGSDGSNGGGAVTAVTVNISCPYGTKFAVQVSLESSVEMLKSVVAKTCDIPAEQQRLIYRGGILKDDQTLKSYGLEAEHTVHLVRRLLPIASNNTDEEGTNGGSGGSSLGTLDVSGFPDLEGLYELIEMLEQPHVQNLMNNPEAFRNSILSYSRLPEITVGDPEFSDILNDPQLFNQMTEVLRNPEYMREVLRISDIADGDSTSTQSARIDLLNSPISQNLLSLVSNLLNMNPMAGANTHLREITGNPDHIHQMSMEEMMALQQSLLSHFGLRVQQNNRDAGQMDRGTARDHENIGLDTVVNMFSGLGTNDSNVYARQLAQLQEMGFSDTRQSLEALAATAGNLPEAVNRLLGQ